MTKARFVNVSRKRSMWNVNKISPKSTSKANIQFPGTLILSQVIWCRITNILIIKRDLNIYTHTHIFIEHSEMRQFKFLKIPVLVLPSAVVIFPWVFLVT